MASPIFRTVSTRLSAGLTASSGDHQCVGSLYAADGRGLSTHSFKISWDCLDGWSLRNNGIKVDVFEGLPSKGLKQCPFCKRKLPVVNKVEIV